MDRDVGITDRANVPQKCRTKCAGECARPLIIGIGGIRGITGIRGCGITGITGISGRRSWLKGHRGLEEYGVGLVRVRWDGLGKAGVGNNSTSWKE